MNNAMSRRGVGPLFALLSLVCSVPIIAVNNYFKPMFSLSFIPYRFLAAAGTILIFIGIVFYISAAISVTHAYNNGRLVTSGVYSICRHPLYAAWAFFIATGGVLLLNSWLCLIIPVIMCAAVKVLTKKEDSYLENKFGASYIAYKQTIPALLPIGWMKGIKE